MPLIDPATPANQSAAQAADWFALLRCSEADASLQAAFREWHADPANATAYERVQALWEDSDFTAALFAAGAKPALRRSARRPALGRRVAAAAVILLAAIGAVIGGGYHIDIVAEHVARPAPPQRIALDDGSALVLDAGAAVDIRYSAETRTILLRRGRLLAEVRRNPARPFVVQAGDMSVEAVGTVYSVARPADGAPARVAVREGRVLVRDQGAAVEIRAGETFGGMPGANVADSFAWAEGRLVFADRPLAEVAAELDRYWPGLIWVRGDALRDLRISGSFRLDDPAEVAVALAAATGAEASSWPGGLLILQRR